MSGIGRFKLSDALPQGLGDTSGGVGSKAKGKVDPSGGNKKAKAGAPAKAASGELTAEQTREIREVTKARNAGPPQAGRLGTGGRRGK